MAELTGLTVGSGTIQTVEHRLMRSMGKERPANVDQRIWLSERQLVRGRPRSVVDGDSTN
jgi:hypothetical protein